MLRAHYNFCLRDRIESYEQVKFPKLGNYCDLKTEAECCPLSCSVSKNSNLGYPYKGNGKKRNAYEQQSSELSTLKKARNWYKSIHSTVLQQNLKRLEIAFKNFFEGRGYPKFKTKQRFKSFNYPPNQVQVEGNKIYLPKIGWMTFFQSRPFPEGFALRSVCVRKKADGWYISIGLENKDIPQSSPKVIEEVESVIGGDLGSNKLLALSNGEQIANPQFEKRLERTKTIRQRRASRKKRGSKNQKKAYQKLARLDQKIVNQRTDYQWKVANHLARLADVIVLEGLHIKGMIKRCQPKKDENGNYVKNGQRLRLPQRKAPALTVGQSAKRALNRLIRDCAWGELKLKIKSVAEKFDCIVVEVNPKHTSQQCSVCGHIDKQNRKGEKFACVECGHIADADNQAAINIAKRGIEQLNLSLFKVKLLGVTQEVTANSETTGDTGNSEETSVSLETEPSNPTPPYISSLKLRPNGGERGGEWMEEQVTGSPESPVIASA